MVHDPRRTTSHKPSRLVITFPPFLLRHLKSAKRWYQHRRSPHTGPYRVSSRHGAQQHQRKAGCKVHCGIATNYSPARQPIQLACSQMPIKPDHQRRSATFPRPPLPVCSSTHPPYRILTVCHRQRSAQNQEETPCHRARSWQAHPRHLDPDWTPSLSDRLEAGTAKKERGHCIMIVQPPCPDRASVYGKARMACRYKGW